MGKCSSLQLRFENFPATLACSLPFLDSTSMSDAEIQSLLEEAKEHEVKLPRGKKVC
jgi:hypothetical protein